MSSAQASTKNVVRGCLLTNDMRQFFPTLVGLGEPYATEPDGE